MDVVIDLNLGRTRVKKCDIDGESLIIKRS